MCAWVNYYGKSIFKVFEVNAKMIQWMFNESKNMNWCEHTNAYNICCHVFYWITIIQYQSMNDNKCIIWIKKFYYLCKVSLKQNLDLHESFEWIRLFWWEGFQIFHYWSFCAANHFFVVLFCIKNVRKYHLHKVNEDFSDIFWSIQKNQQKSDSIQNMPANEYFMQNHTFLMYWGQKGPKKG